MGKAARSTAAEHEADRGAVQESGETCEIVDIVAAGMADKVNWQVLAPLFNRLLYIAGAVMQQDEIERLAPILGLTGRPLRHTERRLCRRHEYDAIGLAQAQSGPSGQYRFGVIEDLVARGLHRIEPFGRTTRRFGIEEHDALTAGRQLIGEIARDAAVLHVLSDRYKRHGSVRRFHAGAAGGCAQALHKLRYDRQHRPRMPLDQPFKGGFPESQQYGVAKRRDG